MDVASDVYGMPRLSNFDRALDVIATSSASIFGLVARLLSHSILATNWVICASETVILSAAVDGIRRRLRELENWKGDVSQGFDLFHCR